MVTKIAFRVYCFTVHKTILIVSWPMGVALLRRNYIRHKAVRPRLCPSWRNPEPLWCSWLANSMSTDDKTGWIQVLQVHTQAFSFVRQFCVQQKKHVELVSSKHIWNEEEQHRRCKGIHFQFFKIEPHEKSRDSDGSCPVSNRFLRLYERNQGNNRCNVTLFWKYPPLFLKYPVSGFGSSCFPFAFSSDQCKRTA